MDFKETAFEYISCDNYGNFSTDEAKWIRKLTALAEQYPSEVQITHTPEENNGTLCAHLPKSWFKITPPRKMTLTDEQREAAKERLIQARQKKGV